MAFSRGLSSDMSKKPLKQTFGKQFLSPKMLIFHRTECCKSPNALFFKVLKVLSHGFFDLNASFYSFALIIALFKVILWLFPWGSEFKDA